MMDCQFLLIKYIISVIILQKIFLDFVTILQDELIRAGVLPQRL